jgi:hypothetical protein
VPRSGAASIPWNRLLMVIGEGIVTALADRSLSLWAG